MYGTEVVSRWSWRSIVGALGVSVTLGSWTPAAAGAAVPLSPGGRGYELVSPSEKHGIDVAGDPTNSRVAVSGNAFEFPAVGGFADVAGSGVVTDYVSVRTGAGGTSGWVTHAITPSQQPSSFRNAFFGLLPRYLGDFSADLSKGVFRGDAPLTDDPNVAQAHNLYLRSGLLAAGPGSSALLTDSVSPVPPPPTNTGDEPAVAGASSDFSHVIFESVLRLTPDAPACTNLSDPVYGCGPLLYEWSSGVVRLAGVLPGGTPAASSVAGRGALSGHYTQHTISQDGSRIVFTDDETGAGSENGALYMRLNGVTTTQINASERTDCADHDPCNGTPEPAAPQPATFGDATPDGSQVYFMTTEQLTNDSPDSATDLYRYDVNAPAGGHLTRLGSDVAGMIGSSADGSYVYFVTNAREIMLWHAGVLHAIGTLANNVDVDSIIYPTLYVITLKTSRVSPDGRFLVFSSTSGAGLTGADQGSCEGVGCSEFYEYDALANGGSGSLRCVSCRPDGLPATSDALSMQRIGQSGLGRGARLPGLLADDGEVFFSTGEHLAGGDVNGSVRDVYEYSPVSNQVQLVSSGHSQFNSYFVEASPDGRDVFFLTRDQLTGWDFDHNYDIYDARRGGGLPDPVVPPPPCSGDACQGPASVAPVEQAPGSATFTAPSDVSPVGVFRVLGLARSQLAHAARSGSLVLGVQVSDRGRVSARARARIGGRSQVVAAAAKTARRGGTLRLRLRLSRALLRTLATHRRVRVEVSVSYSEADGSPQRLVLVLRAGGR